MNRPTTIITLVIAIASLSPAIALGFQPHAECTFSPKPLPLVRDCEDEAADVLWYKNRVAGVNRALDALQDPMSEENQERARDTMDAGKAMADAMGSLPNDPPGLNRCFRTFCRAAVGRALGAAQLGWDLGSLFGNTWADQSRLNDWRNKLAAFKDGLAGANERMDACSNAQAIEAKARDDAEAYNRAGVPKYPADHPLCSPPDDDGGNSGTGGNDNDGKEVKGDDGQRGGDSGGASGGGSGGGSRQGEGTPDWSRTNQFTRAEITQALDWMDRELDTCATLPLASRRTCANATLAHHSKLRGAINRKINAAGSAVQRGSLSAERDRLGALNERRNQLRQR